LTVPFPLFPVPRTLLSLSRSLFSSRTSSSLPAFLLATLRDPLSYVPTNKDRLSSFGSKCARHQLVGPPVASPWSVMSDFLTSLLQLMSRGFGKIFLSLSGPVRTFVINFRCANTPQNLESRSVGAPPSPLFPLRRTQLRFRSTSFVQVRSPS